MKAVLSKYTKLDLLAGSIGSMAYRLDLEMSLKRSFMPLFSELRIILNIFPKTTQCTGPDA